MSNKADDNFSKQVNVRARHVLRFLVLLSSGLTACEVVHQTAVGSYEVATAPFRLFHRSTPTPTPVPPPPPPTPSPAHRTASHASPRPMSASPSPGRSPRQKAHASPSPAKKASPSEKKGNAGPASPSQKPAQSPAFATAKPVPDKPGYVFSPSQPTKYVDVSGYAPGSKVKDPYSGQIFIVP